MKRDYYRYKINAGTQFNTGKAGDETLRFSIKEPEAGKTTYRNYTIDTSKGDVKLATNK